jgi:phosphoribosylformimino-5-aminoimidazole carboxamide ribotide isomerase
MLVIPAIDILDGKVVRVEQGKAETAKEYSSDPLEIAKDFQKHGATIIHVVDLNAAIRQEVSTNREVLEDLLSGLRNSGLQVQIAGGIRSRIVARQFIELGAARIVLGSICYSKPEEAKSILRSIREEEIILALDYDEKGFVRTNGWKNKEEEEVENALSRFYEFGFRRFLLTSIKRDGMLEGPDLLNLKKLRKSFPKGGVKIIASGGVTTEIDLRNLEQIGIDEIIIGKAFYERRIAKSVLSIYK